MPITYHFDYLPARDQKFKNKKDRYLTFALVPENYFFDKKVEQISIFVDSQITSQILKFFPNLKVIFCRSIGTNNVDLNFCEKHGIKVGHIQDYGHHIIAHHAMALFLTGARCLRESQKSGFYFPGLVPVDIKGKTAGVIGAGHIGKEIIHLLKAFGANVIVHDVHPKAYKTIVPLHDLYKKSDFIFLACNLHKENFHMINARAIAQMKQGVMLINIARGGLIDEKALLKYHKKFSFVGLDVLELETAVYRKKFTKYPNIFITPHVAYIADSSIKKIWDATYKVLN